IKNQGLG
uniref:Uncharacterized protein n=1 Tax=Acrobeloides nanus TaxID=290746 RepID=A0A914D013_9BILA